MLYVMTSNCLSAILTFPNEYLFEVLRRFQHCAGHITTGSWKGRGNQYIQFDRVSLLVSFKTITFRGFFLSIVVKLLIDVLFHGNISHLYLNILLSKNYFNTFDECITCYFKNSKFRGFSSNVSFI